MRKLAAAARHHAKVGTLTDDKRAEQIQITESGEALGTMCTALGIRNVQHVCIFQCNYTGCYARSCMQHDSPY